MPSPIIKKHPKTKPLSGYVDNLTPTQMDELKKMWIRLINLFEQKAHDDDTSSKGSTRSKAGKRTPVERTDLFLGSTIDPTWMTLPLEKALPLIPGRLFYTTFWNMVSTDNPDAVVLRFLRSRKWKLEAAYNLLTETLRWRLYMRLDDIVSLGESGIRNELNRLKPKLGDCFMKQIISQKVYLSGPDKYNRPICTINVRKHYKEDQPFEIIQILTLYFFETIRLLVHQPLETVCIIFNMEGFTMKNMDFEFVKFLVTCFEFYYPEMLGSCLIHKAPWMFSKIWCLITPILSPEIASKIRFTKNTHELKKYVNPCALPKRNSRNSTISKIDIMQVQLVPAGNLKELTTVEYEEYMEMIEQYQAETLEWTLIKSENGDSAVRRMLAKEYRVARIKAEKDIRGPTESEKRGLYAINRQGNIIIDFGGDWIPLNVTNMV
ncbi:unnamed protein product [Rhizopus stolonifer]